MARKKLKKYNNIAYLWILPAFALMLLFCYYPPIKAIQLSFLESEFFRDAAGILSKRQVFAGFGNYIQLFQDPDFFLGMKNVVILALAGILIGNLATFFLAELLFNCKATRAAKVYRFLFIIPILVPGMVNMMMWQRIILSAESTGLMNSILRLFGGSNSGWYYSEQTVIFSIIFTGFPWVAGTSFLIYLAGLQSIPTEVGEAGQLDGLTTMKRIWYMDIPMILGQIKYFLIMGIIGGFQGFNVQLLFTGAKYGDMVPGYQLYYHAFAGGEGGFEYASTIGCVIFILTLILTVVNFKFFRTSEEVAEK